MKTFRVGACLFLLLGSGVAHGLLTHRWQSAEDFSRVQARLNNVGTTLGRWSGQEVPMSSDELDRVSIRAHLSREYRHDSTGQVVRVLVVAGPPGPISVHTPDVCFRGSGYEQSSPQESAPIGKDGERLWAATFAKPGPVKSQLRVYWGWNGGGGWEAPDHRRARYQFAFRPILYKVYLVTDASRPSDSNQSRPVEDLAAELFPAIERALSEQS